MFELGPHAPMRSFALHALLVSLARSLSTRLSIVHGLNAAGFCALSEKLPLAQIDLKTELTTPAVKYNGLNAPFGQTVHCVAAEPTATFLRVGILDGSQEVAYETAVLGRLRVGYRVFQMRSMLGTRIELCYLFVKISTGSEPNQWGTPRQVSSKTLSELIVVCFALDILVANRGTYPPA